jgi:hypothetical protein
VNNRNQKVLPPHTAVVQTAYFSTALAILVVVALALIEIVLTLVDIAFGLIDS